jgi:protein-tyrosine phosphatase
LIDIHCHVLPGVDDGADVPDTAVAMLARGADDGTSAAVLTPHLYPEDGAEKCQLHQETFETIIGGTEMELHLGAEIRFRFGMADLAAHPAARLAGGPYVLVDLPFGTWPLEIGLERGFFELRAAGYKPILAHPERHPQLFDKPDILGRLRQQELHFQVNGGSFSGRFGRRARAAAEGLLDRGWVELVASDAHDLERRTFSLLEARQLICRRWGEAEARRLLEENPRRVLDGMPLSGAVRRRTTHRPGLWRRLVGSWR